MRENLTQHSLQENTIAKLERQEERNEVITASFSIPPLAIPKWLPRHGCLLTKSCSDTADDHDVSDAS